MSTTLYVPTHRSGQRALPHLYATAANLWIFAQSNRSEWHVEMVSGERQEAEQSTTPSSLDIGRRPSDNYARPLAVAIVRAADAAGLSVTDYLDREIDLEAYQRDQIEVEKRERGQDEAWFAQQAERHDQLDAEESAAAKRHLSDPTHE